MFIFSLPALYNNNLSEFNGFPSDLDSSSTSVNTGASPAQNYGEPSTNYNTPPVSAQTYDDFYSDSQSNEYGQLPKQSGNFRIANLHFKNGTEVGIGNEGDMVGNNNLPKIHEHGVTAENKGKF